MNITLLSHTPDPEMYIAVAAKLCYSDLSISQLGDNLTEDSITKYINMLMDLGHESPLEHVTFTFGIEGISRACSHQLVRHRIASYSQRSQRYVSESGFQYVTPKAIEDADYTKVIYDNCMREIDSAYKSLQAMLKQYHRDNTFANLPEPERSNRAAKQANDDARFVLPNACNTSIIVTMNARSLLNFFKLRCCKRAMCEMQEVAINMLKLCKEVAPNLFAKAGPSCISDGRCSEGKMCCGDSESVKATIGKI